MAAAHPQQTDSSKTFEESSKLHQAWQSLACLAAFMTCATILYHINGPAPFLDRRIQITEYITSDTTNMSEPARPNSEPGPYVLSQRFIDRINARTVHWKAGKNFPPSTTRAQLRRLVRGKRRHSSLEPLLPLKTLGSGAMDVPENFDARQQWPQCSSIREIRNQGCCGSCWAFSAVEVMSDRQCIIAGSEFRYSAQDVVSCSGQYGVGCDGGSPGNAFNMWKSHGIVSGGPFNSSEGCVPYLISECSPDNHGQVDDTPKCDQSCRPGYDRTYEADKHFASEIYRLYSERDILQEIFERGPMTVRFSVYEDFYNYKEGVYHHVDGNFQGDHVVKVIGFGVENGMPYYLCANSWGYEWGDGGFFKIVRKATDPYMNTGVPRLN